MSDMKTRIFGSSPLLAPPHPANAPAPQQEGSADPSAPSALADDGLSPALEPAAPPLMVRDSAARISPRTGTRIMNLATLLPGAAVAPGDKALMLPDLADEPVRAATRVMPIERLAAGLGRAGEAPAVSSPAASSPDASLTAEPPGTQVPREKNVMRMLCLSLLVLCAVIWAVNLFVAPVHAPRSPAPPSGAALAESEPPSEAAPEASERKGAVVIAHAPEPAPNTESGDAEGAPDPMPRLAVDALALGDDARAELLYQELASRYADQPVYAEAARILRARVAERR